MGIAIIWKQSFIKKGSYDHSEWLCLRAKRSVIAYLMPARYKICKTMRLSRRKTSRISDLYNKTASKRMKTHNKFQSRSYSRSNVTHESVVLLVMNKRPVRGLKPLVPSTLERKSKWFAVDSPISITARATSSARKPFETSVYSKSFRAFLWAPSSLHSRLVS